MDLDPIRELVLRELSLSPKPLHLLLRALRRHCPFEDRGELRDALNSVLLELAGAAAIGPHDDLRDHFVLVKHPGSSKTASSRTKALPIPELDRDQMAILRVLLQPGYYDRSTLASAIDPRQIGVDESRITRAVSGQKGLKSLGLVSHARRTGYRLTAQGRDIADRLSS
jgi:hypothetical protein